jgi:polyferredoxin
MMSRDLPPFAPPPSTVKVQRLRRLTQAGFFLVFVFAPLLNLFRFDLAAGHFIVLGMPWTLGIDDFTAHRISGAHLALNLLLRGALPIVLGVLAVLYLSWRYGRIYCGWLCPHFSVVETINQTMRRAIGRQSVWEKQPQPARNPDGTVTERDAIWWLAVLPLAVGFAFLWVISFMSYVWAPWPIWHGLVHGGLPRFQQIILTVGTLAFSMEFLFARHLFCRFACAAGLFQSLAWMGNRQAMVVGFERGRAPECAGCESECDNACPMRLKPRNVKRMMFSCVQCGQCLNACAHVHKDNPEGPLLHWVHEDRAGDEASFNTRTAKQGERNRIPVTPVRED